MHLACICECKFYRLIKSGELPHYRIGRSIRVSQEDFNKWLENHKNGGNNDLRYFEGEPDKTNAE